MSFLVNDEPILIVTSGDQKIDNSKFKSEFHTKARMIPIEEVENKIGHDIGGVCPFGIKENVKIYLDETLKQSTYIYPACGSSNSAIQLTPTQLENILPDTHWVNVCRK